MKTSYKLEQTYELYENLEQIYMLLNYNCFACYDVTESCPPMSASLPFSPLTDSLDPPLHSRTMQKPQLLIFLMLKENTQLDSQSNALLQSWVEKKKE